MNEPQSPLGFAHFIAQSDSVSRALLALLVAMSVLSWAIVVMQAVTRALQRRAGERFLQAFWNSRSIDDVRAGLDTDALRDPFAQLAADALQAHDHHARHGATRLAEAGTLREFVTRRLKQSLDAQSLRMEWGLTTLGTVGATAPFVGLFGTVWGVYHALVAIGMSGAGTLDRVAGPVGEALIMTGIGLAVAIPAVVACNAFVRGNRVLDARLDAFAAELLTLLTTGHALPSAAPAGDSRGRGAERSARTATAAAAH